MDTSHSILRFAKRFFAGTMLSRFSGAMRDVAMAYSFGSSPEIAAFMVAYRLANLFRRLFGEGTMQSGFVPHFAHLHKENPKNSFLFFRDSTFTLLTIVLFAIGGIELAFWGICPFLEPDWSEIVSLAMWMVPGLAFICLFGLNSAFLQFQKHYFTTGAAPALFNTFWMIAIFLSAPFSPHEAVRFLCVAVTLAFAAQWAMTAIQVRRDLDLSVKEWLFPKLFSSDWKRMAKPLSFGVIGVGAVQINSALDAIFSRFSDISGPAYLWYALRIEQLPLALFGIALSGALLPPLSRAIAQGEISRYAELLKGALRHSAALLIPCTFALFALGEAGVNLLYGRGHFSPMDVEKTLDCLWGYGVGLVPSVFVLMLASGFYAQKSYLIPMAASLASVVFHIACNAFLVFGLHLGAFSIALSTSLSAALNGLILAYFVRKRLGVNPFSGFFPFLGRLVLCSTIAALTAFSMKIALFSEDSLPRSLGEQCLRFCSMGAGFIAAFLIASYRMGIKELFELFGKG